MAELFESRAINAAALREDDFAGLGGLRAAALLDLVERATGRPVDGRDSDEVAAVFGGPLVRHR